MTKTKQDYINTLVTIAFKMDDKATRLQRMATLAQQGKKESEEFKALETQLNAPTVTDFGDEMNELQNVVKHLRRYKWEK